MLLDEVGDDDLGRLRSDCVTRLQDAVAGRRDALDGTVIQAIDAGALEELTIEDAAGVLAGEHGAPSADVIRAELLDRILIGMSTAVIDVDTLAREITLDRSAKELQQRIEGRAPMTLAEFVDIRHAIAARSIE